MNIFLVIVCTALIIFTVSDAIIAIRNLIYQKKWDEEKDNIIRNNPAITAAELCVKYLDFCVRNNCIVEY
jgi:uncharacterized membrane protein